MTALPLRRSLVPLALGLALVSACGGETEPVEPAIVVEDQTLDPPNVLVVKQAALPVRGFLVIREDNDGVPGAAIATSLLMPGDNAEIVVIMDRVGRDGETLHAILHNDTGRADEFEFESDPTVDAPLTTDAGDVVKTSFVVTVDEAQVVPEIRALEQTANPADEVTVAFVRSPGPGFVTVRQDVGGEPGRVLGFVAVDAGESANLTVELDREATDTEVLHAVLHVDDNEVGTFEFTGNDGKDDPLLDAESNLVAARFLVRVPVVIGPSVEVDDQLVQPLTRVVVRSVVSDGPGFVAIRADEAGSVGAILGFTSVSTGTTADVIVDLDREVRDGETLYAALHVDEEPIGAFDFPADSAKDGPASGLDGNAVISSFEVRFDAQVVAIDQDVDPTNRVVVFQTIVDGAGWLVVRDDPSDPTSILGRALLGHGTTQDIEVTLSRDVQDDEVLYAALHVDDGVPGSFEFNGGANNLDLPILDGDGNAVSTPFQVSFEADLRVRDQFADPRDQVVVGEVTSTGPGFVVVYADDGGVPGDQLGFAAVENGRTASVAVTLERGVGQGETLHARLHLDTGTVGTFEFTGSIGSADPPATNDRGGVVVRDFATQFVDIEVLDQDVDPTDVIAVSAVTSQGPGFVAIYADANGAPGALLGFTAVAAGTTTATVVQLDRSVDDGERLHAALHIDAGQVGAFEPDGADTFATLAGAEVLAPFTSTFQWKLSVSDQPLPSPADNVFVQDIISKGPGWVVIRESNGGNRGRIIGRVAIVNGSNRNLAIALDRDAVVGETLYATVHIDVAVVGDFVFDENAFPPPPATDLEVVLAGNLLQTTFQITP